MPTNPKVTVCTYANYIGIISCYKNIEMIITIIQNFMRILEALFEKM